MDPISCQKCIIRQLLGDFGQHAVAFIVFFTLLVFVMVMVVVATLFGIAELETMTVQGLVDYE
jgi:hypothetical protein